MKDMEMTLCRQCVEALRSDGRTVTSIRAGVDEKATCQVCGKRRYCGTYAVSREVRP